MKKWMQVVTLSTLFVMPAFGARYCGVVPSISYQTDIFEVIRMGVKKTRNSDPSLPAYVTVKDSRAIEKMIGIISDNPYYAHDSDMHDYSWSFERTAETRYNPYFVCVVGSEFRDGKRGGVFMDDVKNLRVWVDKEPRGDFDF